MSVPALVVYSSADSALIADLGNLSFLYIHIYIHNTKLPESSSDAVVLQRAKRVIQTTCKELTNGAMF